MRRGLRRFPLPAGPRDRCGRLRTRRARAGVTLVLLLAGGVCGAAAQGIAPLRIIHEGDAARVPVRLLNGVEMVALREVADAVSGALRPGAGDREVELLVAGERIRIEAGRSFVGVGRRDRLLANPVVLRGGDWYVPIDFVSRVLLDVLPPGSRYDQGGRALAVGGGHPTLEVDILPRPGMTRIEVATDPPVSVDLEESGRGFRILVDAPFVETAFVGEAPRDGVVERVDLRQIGDRYVLDIMTGRSFSRLRQERSSGRFALDLIRSGVRAESGAGILPPLPGMGPEPVRPRPDLSRRPAAAREIRIVAIDPGHGGSDFGAAGSGRGLSEKDLTLSVALALARLLEREHGLQVVLTRESDREVGLDDRAVVANAARADLLVSLHVNASPSPNARGVLVYHHAPISSARPADGQAVRFVAWQEAQAAALPGSRELARAIAGALANLELPVRGVADAPVRLLAGAAMPAVQVELGFITSQRDRRVLGEPGFPERAARAIADGILRFRTREPSRRPTGGVR